MILCTFLVIFLHHDIRMYDLYAPIVPEINDSILFYVRKCYGLL